MARVYRFYMEGEELRMEMALPGTPPLTLQAPKEALKQNFVSLARALNDNTDPSITEELQAFKKELIEILASNNSE